MRAIEITIPTTPYDTSAQIARLREFGVPESMFPKETNRQMIVKERLSPLLGFYKNCTWGRETSDTESLTLRYIHFQYRPTIVFTELKRLHESGVITEARIGVLDKQAVFIAQRAI